jgi:CO dehydrogenase nickel-insertion accessory protein CooC1
MSKTIAVAGKGGTGKTSISALLTNILSKKGVVLAIDGDRLHSDEGYGMPGIS